MIIEIIEFSEVLQSCCKLKLLVKVQVDLQGISSLLLHTKKNCQYSEQNKYWSKMWVKVYRKYAVVKKSPLIYKKQIHRPEMHSLPTGQTESKVQSKVQLTLATPLLTEFLLEIQIVMTYFK